MTDAKRQIIVTLCSIQTGDRYELFAVENRQDGHTLACDRYSIPFLGGEFKISRDGTDLSKEDLKGLTPDDIVIIQTGSSQISCKLA